MKFVKNMLYSTVYQMLSIIVPLITTPYVSRVLGATGIGINAYTYSIVMYFVLAGGLGIQLYGNREIAYNQRNIEEKSKVFYELVILKFIAIFIASIPYLIFSMYQGDLKIYFMLQGLALLGSALDISWYFMGVENFRILVVRNTIARLLLLILTFVLVKTANDLWIYIFLTMLAPLLGNLTVWPFLKKEFVPVKFRDLNILRHLKPTLLLFLPQITMTIYLSLNKTMLGIMDGVVSAGYYSQSDMIIRTAFTLVSSFASAFLPRLSSLFSEKKHSEIKNLTLKSFDLSVALSILIMAGIMGVSQTFAIFFFGKDFEEVGPLIFVQSLMILFVGIAVVAGNQYLLAANRTKEYTISVSIGLAVNVIFNFIMIPFFGVMGAVITTVLTELSVALYQLWAIRDVFTLKEIMHGFWKYLIAGLATFIVVFVLEQIMNVSVLSYTIQAVLGTLVYALIVWLLQAPIVAEVKNIIRLRRQH